MKYMKNVFVDTNLWIYAFIEVKDKEEKRNKILSFLEELNKKSKIQISIQVINEFHWTSKRKYKLDDKIIKKKVTAITEIVEINSISFKNYQFAEQLREKYSLSFWDSLITSSALLSDSKILYSEDMQHEQIIENQLKIINPFI